MGDTPVRQPTFKRNAHIQYFLRCLRALPTQAQDHDSNRITIAFFCLSGLELLGALEEKTVQQQRHGWIEWVWRLQAASGGFAGSTFLTTPPGKSSVAHLPSTYTALLVLGLLRAPLDRLDVRGTAAFIASCQGHDGSFSPLATMVPLIDEGFQSDVRMTYCASVISSIIGGSDIDKISARLFVTGCKTWEGGYASRPGTVEAQGGTTYCSVASLSLLSERAGGSDAPYVTADRAETLRWLCARQIGGFQGRPGKDEDVCYSFWCGAAMQILEENLVDQHENRDFLLSAQFPLGGFGKEPEDYPDPYHSYLAIAALALGPSAAELGLKRLDPLWNVSLETKAWLLAEVGRVKAAGQV